MASLVGREFDPRPSCVPDLVNWYVSLLTNQAHGVRKSCGAYPERKKTSQMMPDLVNTQSWRYKTVVVIKCHQTTAKLNKVLHPD